MIGCAEMTKQPEDQPEVQPTEVKPKRGTRRTYPIFYKKRILTLVDQCWRPPQTVQF